MHLNMQGSVPLGSVLGIPIRLHLLFLVTLGAQLLGSIYYGGDWVLLWFLLLGPVLLITVLIHELGHCLATRSVGILLWPLGGLAFIGHTAGPKADMWVAVAGPLTHVPMIGFWVGMLSIAQHAATGSWTPSLALQYPRGAGLAQAMCAGAVIINLSLFVFNLLIPAYPLDGGRILVDALLAGGVEPELTAKITCGVAAPIGIGIMVWGALPPFQMVTILVGFFILHSTWQLFSALRAGVLRQHPMFAYDESTADANYFKFPGAGSGTGPGAGSQV